MTERPILFSAPMVRAILDGKKTQTRQILKGSTEFKGPYNPAYLEFHRNAHGWASICPYGKPGDRLWVREAMRISDLGLVFDADAAKITDIPAGWEDVARRPHVTAMFMPRWASRIMLEITEVRVQRLQDISGDDCLAEGIVITDSQRYNEGRFEWGEYGRLWESIHGPGSWDANPWVWAIGFKVVKLETGGPKVEVALEDSM